MKRRMVIVVLIVGTLVLLGSCASKKKAAPLATPPVMGAEGIMQPEWVYRPPTDALLHYESGYGRMSDKQTSIKRATVEAKNKIAQWINTSVEEVIVTYLNDAGSGDDRHALDAMQVISTQIAEATISGVTTEDVWVDADNGVWVLCSVPLEKIQQTFAPASAAVADAFSSPQGAEDANAQMQAAFAALLQK